MTKISFAYLNSLKLAIGYTPLILLARTAVMLLDKNTSRQKVRPVLANCLTQSQQVLALTVMPECMNATGIPLSASQNQKSYLPGG